MRPIGSSRPNRFIAAAVIGVIVAIAASRIGGAQSNEFRFEDYSGERYDKSGLEAEEAVKAQLYKLFPKGSQPERLPEFIESIGGFCTQSPGANFIKKYGNALHCIYSHPYPGEPYLGHNWIIYVFREHDVDQISKIELKSRIVGP